MHYNGVNSYLFVNGTKIIKFKAKLWNCTNSIMSRKQNDNMKKTNLNGYVYDVSVDYDAIEVDDILDIHKYLMEKNGIV